MIYAKTQRKSIQTTVEGRKEWAWNTYVTDHEIYRMFAGKYRKRILDNALFADDTLRIIKPGKRKNYWYNKNQLSRWFRIKFKSL